MTRAAVATALLLAVPATAGGAEEPAVRAPKSGSEYRGDRRDVILRVAGKSVEIIAFSFPCGSASGRTSLTGLALERTRRGYRFEADVRGIVSYSDGQPDENGKIHVNGRFAPDARTVRGRFRVRTPRCGDTCRLRWNAERRRTATP